MNTVVLNDRNTTVMGNHSETIGNQQSIEVMTNRYVEIKHNSTTQVKKQIVNVGETYQLLVDGNINIASEHAIVLKTKNAFIHLTPNQIDINGKMLVAINGMQIFLNPQTVDSQEASILVGKVLSNPEDFLFLHNEISAISKDSSGILNANSKILTANGSISLNSQAMKASVSGAAALVDINATSIDEKSGFGMKISAASGNSEISSTGMNGEVEVSAVSLNGKYGGEYGSIEGGAKVFSADAEAKGNVFGGENGKYGVDGRVATQASAISAEGKACLGTEESFAMICGKVGGNVGPAFDLGGKVIWDNTNEQLEAGGMIKILGGFEVEGQVNWNKIKGWLK